MRETRKRQNDNFHLNGCFYRPQHTGFGRRLVAVAEVITLAHGLRRMAVIAGIGTQQYYRKFGYEVEDYFMTKRIDSTSVSEWVDHLGLSLPLRVQLYNTITDLGELDEGTTIPDELVETMASTEIKNIKKLSSKQDVLSPLEGNCSSLMKSHSNGVILIFIDHIETESSCPRHPKETPTHYYPLSLLSRISRTLYSFRPSTTLTLVSIGFFVTMTWRWSKWRKAG